jgi:hypothetical protein
MHKESDRCFEGLPVFSGRACARIPPGLSAATQFMDSSFMLEIKVWSIFPELYSIPRELVGDSIVHGFRTGRRAAARRVLWQWRSNASISFRSFRGSLQGITDRKPNAFGTPLAVIAVFPVDRDDVRSTVDICNCRDGANLEPIDHLIFSARSCALRK